MNPGSKSSRTYSLQRRMQVLAATSVIAAIFIVLTVTWIVTHMQTHDLAAESSIRTSNLLRELAQAGDQSNVSASLQEDLDDMLRQNPGGWYYYEDSERVIRSSPDGPRYRDRMLDGAVELPVPEGELTTCSRTPLVFMFDSPDGRAYVRSGGCGEDANYMEVVGFEVGVSPLAHIWWVIEADYFAQDRIKNRVAPTLAIVLLTTVAVTLLFGTLMKRVGAVSRAASEIGKGKHNVRLPEDNLPKEVLPMVQAINRAIGRLEAASEQQALFVAAAAHELRTPLTVFRTRLEQMAESKLKDELVDDMRRVDSMVSQLLALAKLGASELDLEKLDLADVVRDTCMLRGGAVFAAGKELSFDASDKSAQILGDRESVKTAVANLIDNALMFTPEGRSVHVGVEDNRVVVSDEGPGVAQEDRERIFEPFYKNPPNKRGHGLGLAIVSEIMRIHDGTVALKDGKGSGAVFELTFQRAA